MWVGILKRDCASVCKENGNDSQRGEFGRGRSKAKRKKDEKLTHVSFVESCHLPVFTATVLPREEEVQ